MTTFKLQLHSLRQLLVAATLLTASAVAALGLVSANTAAQADESSVAANALRVSPVRNDVTVEPGNSEIVKVVVTNPSDQTVGVRVIQNDFIAGDEDGTPAIYLEETEFAPSHSLKRFMTPIENLTLGPNEARAVDVKLAVPADAEPGGYYGVVRFAPTSADGGGQVNVTASVASLILMTVPGDAPEKLEITDFAVRQDGSNKAFFTSGDGVALNLRFENTGNIHAGPFGKVSVLKGDTIVHEADFNNKEQRDMVLPNSARRFSVPLGDISGFGRYTVSATFTYGSDNQTIEATETFWVIPGWTIATGIVVLLVIAGGIGYLIYRRGQKTPKASGIGKRR